MNTIRLDEEAIFQVARRIPSAEARGAYLEQVCGQDRGLRDRLDALLRVYEQEQSFLEVPPTGPGGADPTADITPLAEGPGTVIGPYKLLEVIGEGGMGVVYMAEQQKPVRRKVALKIIKPGMDTKQVIARFEAERQALALMDHPNIARVLDAGATESGRPYFVMELVKGILITDYCDRNRLTIADRLELFAQVCQAVQHAHQKGIIHRDLKPSNVLVTLIDGAAVPKVIDFGVAKAMGQQLTERTLFTGFAQLVGTPLYMSPEQAEFSGVDVDTRSDIYSLGVLLYELLTGTTPFDAATFRTAAYEEIRRIIREQEPPRPSTRIRTLETTATAVSANRRSDPRSLGKMMRGELDWIVMKALEKDRRRRYETANTLVADLRRYLNHEPVEAGPPSAWYRLRKYARRNRAVLATAAVVATALVIGTGVSTWEAVRAMDAERLAQGRLDAERAALLEVSQQRNRADAARREADRRATEARERAAELDRQLYINRVNRSYSEWRENNVALAEQLLDECPQILRSWEWSYCKRLCHLDLITLRGHAGRVLGVAVSSDGKWIASGDNDGLLILWDATSGKPRWTVRGAGDDWNYARGPVFSPDGTRIAWRGRDGTLTLFDAATGEVRATFRREKAYLSTFAFSPDGKVVASNNRDRSVSLWEVASGKERVTLTGHTSHVCALAFSPDERWIASAVWDGTVRLYHSDSGREARVLRGHDGFVFDVAFSPDGSKLASAGWDNTIRLWAMPSGDQQSVLRGHTSFVRSVAFSPDGRQISSAGEDQTIRLWDATSGQEIEVLRGHTAFVTGAEFTPDGSRIVSGSYDGTVKVWDPTMSQHCRTLRGHTGWVQSVAFNAEVTRLVSAGTLFSSRPGEMKLWDLSSGREILGFRGHTGLVYSVACDASGKCIASASNDRTIRLWDPQSGRLLRTLGGHTARVNHVAFSPDGERIVSAGEDGTVRLWDTQTGNEVRVLKGHRGVVVTVVFSPDGKWIASGGNDGAVRLWDTGTGQGIRECPDVHVRNYVVHPLERLFSTTLAFSPDGKWIASTRDNEVEVLDAATGKVAGALRGHSAEVNAVAFSPDGRRIASASNDLTIGLWDAVTHQLIFSLRGHTSGVLSVVFSRDGSRIASGSIDFTVRVWDARPLGQEAPQSERSSGAPG